LASDTPETLQKRVLEAEYRALPRAIELFEQGKLKIKGKQVRILD
jgi:phosphoribosylglycinamide formyltransferase-1